MQFELTEPTTAKVLEVDVLSDKDRAPDTNPGAALSMSITTVNDILTQFDSFLRGMFYTAVEGKQEPRQQGLEGVAKVTKEVDTDLRKLTNIGTHIREVSWEMELIGYTFYIDYGTAGKSAITIENCKLSNFKFQPKEGGSTVVKFRLEAPDVSEQVHGKLALLKTQEIVMTLTAPVVQGEEAPLSNPLPFDADRPTDKTPEQAFAEAGLVT